MEAGKMEKLLREFYFLKQIKCINWEHQKIWIKTQVATEQAFIDQLKPENGRSIKIYVKCSDQKLLVLDNIHGNIAKSCLKWSEFFLLKWAQFVILQISEHNRKGKHLQTHLTIYKRPRKSTFIKLVNQIYPN